MNIRNAAMLIAILFGLFLFLLIIGVEACLYQQILNHSRRIKNNPQIWLFYDLGHSIYEFFFGKYEPDEAAMKLGIKIEDYYKNCAIAKTEANTERLVVHYLYGLFSFAISILGAILFNPLFLLGGFTLYFYFAMYETEHVRAQAEERRKQVESELPQFLDLLATELAVGLPIDSAIGILSNKYDCLLSREFLESMNDVKLGAGGWQAALEKVAMKYSIDILSDFVSDITVSFHKGIKVEESVAQKTKDIKQKHLLRVKERAGRTENTILLPIALFQFIPMFIFILLPVLLSIVNF